MKAVERFFPIMLYKVVLTLESVDEMLHHQHKVPNMREKEKLIHSRTIYGNRDNIFSEAKASRII